MSRLQEFREMAAAYASDVLTGRKVYYNGNEWETLAERLLRRTHALETHIQDLEKRYAELEGRFNDHSQGRRHAPQRTTLPTPDSE